MTLAALDGTNRQPKPAEHIATGVKDLAGLARRLWVTGHSLGAALATYLTFDLQTALVGTNVELKPYFFASPLPGTQDFADNYQNTVAAYDVVNYAADLVPTLPTDPPFTALNSGGATHNVHIIQRGLPGAPPRTLNPLVNIPNNHSPVTYARMLDPNNVVAKRLPL